MRLATQALLLVALASPAFASDQPALGVEGSEERVAAQLRRAEHAFRKKWGGLTAEEIAPGPVKPERNRALRIIEAIEIFKAMRDRSTRETWFEVTAEYSVSRAGQFAEEHKTELTRYESVLTLLDTIDLMPDSNFGIRYGDSRHLREPFSVIATIDLVRFLAVSGMTELSATHCDVTIRRFEVLLSIGDAFSREPNTAAQIHRGHSDQRALGLLRAVLSHCDLTRKELQRLSLLLERDGRSPIEMILLDQVLGLHPLFDGLRELRASSAEEGPLYRVKLVDAANLHAIRFLNELFEFATTERNHRGDPPVLPDLGVRVVDEIEDESETVEQDVNPLNVVESMLSEGEMAVLLHLMLSDLDEWITRSDLWQTRFLLAHTAVSLELYAKDHKGRFPRTLEGLVPHYLGQPPINPFTGETFEYEAAENGYQLIAGKDAESHSTNMHDSVLDWSRIDRRTLSSDPERSEQD